MAATLMSAITTPVQKVAAVVAATFLLVGVAGFIPGLTTNYDEMEFAGHDSGAMLLDVFQVSILHNAVHLLFGLVGLALVRSWGGARMFLLGGGAAYGLVWLYGVIVDKGEDANFLPVNEADDWLHLGLAVAMMLLGVVLGREQRPVGGPDLS
jgi:hypothetical protein